MESDKKVESDVWYNILFTGILITYIKIVLSELIYHNNYKQSDYIW